MSLTVKVYLEKSEGSAPEIRRFALDQDVSTSFAYVQKKIAQVYPGLETQAFSLYWKDAEGDYIAFSSDAELFEALSQLGEDIFRVYIKVSGKSGENQGEKVHHEGVVCDGCENGIYGARFKCTMCPDYDLCEGCEKKGLHADHFMIRIRVPGQPWMGFFPPHCHPHGPRGRHGQWHRGGRRGPFGPGPHGPPPHGPEGQGPCGPGPHHEGFPPPPHHWGRWMKHAMHNFWQFPAASAQDQNTEEKKESEKQGGDKDKQTNNENTNQFAGAEYLRSVGETVAAMLDPMGIDVEIDVEHGGDVTRCGKARQNQNNGSRTDDVEMKEGGNAPNETAAKEPHSEQKKGEATDGNSTNQTGSAGQNKEQTDSGWTFLQGMGSASNPTSQGGATVVYPSLPNESIDPSVAELLTQMEAMGFTNEDGWLTSLIIAKQGDIGKVLDALQPVKNA